MSSLSKIKILKKLTKNNVKFVTPVVLRRLFSIDNQDTLYKTLQGLEKEEILYRVAAGKYLVTGLSVDDFELANFIFEPSYVSLETALSYYGVLPQFAFGVTSVTLNKSKRFVYKKSFDYTHLKKDLYWGFTKEKNYLIARPEKALLDMSYLASKGWRGLSIEELDLSQIDKKMFRKYCQKINVSQFRNFIEKHDLC